jgi:putative aldouronate transport system permease protein
LIELTRNKSMPSQKQNKATEKAVSAESKGFWRELRQSLPWWVMAVPGILFLLVFSYLPMAGIIIAFKNYKINKGVLGSDWVGFQNFRFLFGTQTAFRITSNTLTMNAIFIATTLIVALTLAILMNEVQHTRRFTLYQSALFFPYFISWIVVGYLAFAFLSTEDGLANHLLISLGIKPINWYSQPKYWPFILTLINLWKSAGFWSIVYLSGMLSISPEIFESATIDGASKWQQIIYITIPLLMPIIIINILLSIGRIFYADFGLFFSVTRDSKLIYPRTDVIDTFVYRALKGSGDIGMAAAAGLYQSFVGFFLVFLSNWIVRRIDPDKSLF